MMADSKVPIAPLEQQLDAALEQKTPKRNQNVDYALKFLAAAIGGTSCRNHSFVVDRLMNVVIYL